MNPVPPHAGKHLVSATSSSPIRQVSSLCTTRLAAGFGIASFLSVASGCMVASSAGGSSRVWVPTAIAWVLGAALAGLTSRLRPATFLRPVLLLGIAGLLISLWQPGMSGVHRWIALGPLRWNVAFLLLPAVSVALAAEVHRSGFRWACAAALVIQVALWFQPDASQATAFAAAMILIVATTQRRLRSRLGAGLLFALIAAGTWTRPDPLAPVPEVEGILQVALAQSRGAATLCVASIVVASMSPLLAWAFARPFQNLSAVALAVYFLTSSVMPFFGAFPVPLSGMGMSPVIGFWLGIGALMAVCNSGTHDPAPHGVDNRQSSVLHQHP